MDLFSDSDSFSESSGSEEQDDMEMFYGGHACSILSSLEETIGKIDDFLSFERGFILGDVVCSATDPSDQMGKVVKVDMFIDLESQHGKIVKAVNSRKIQKIRSISVGDYVVLGSWLGKVDKIVDRVTILFNDGTKSEYTTTGPEKIIPIPPDSLEDAQYPYYPGQRVRIELSAVSKSAKWLCGTWKEKQDEGTILNVEAGLVYVDWLASALVGHERVPVPLCLQDSKNLTLLSCFSHANWQLGDWCILPNTDIIGCDLVKGHKHSKKVNPKLNEMFVIVKTKTIVEVMWQDGRHSMGLDAQTVFPVDFVDTHDFWPDQFVMEKGNGDDPQVPSGQRWGVVRCVNAKERTVTVNWRSYKVSQDLNVEREQMEETVSAYELVEHPDYSYSLGDVVFRLGKNQSADNVGQSGHSLTGTVVGEEADLCKNCEKNNFRNNGYSSSIGIVMGFKDGKVEVKWASGNTTEVAPYEIFRMDKHESPPPSPMLHGENVELLTPEITEHDKNLVHHKGKDILDYSARSLPQVAIGAFASIVGSLFGAFGSISVSCTSKLASDKGHDLVSNIEEEEPESFSFQMLTQTNLEEQVNDISEERSPPLTSVSKFPEIFKQFDMVTGCLDHHFAEGAGKGSASSQVRKGWLRKVQQEWSSLAKDLPETIYVRVYEERMDLLRAAIIGAPGTPYHDGIFFFDIFLPPEYPHQPPLLHYNSGGLRINPNLYESGKVCLSLLNTWTGTETEVWNPGSSTILQVLLSLQALVLNEKPYFNEAGYDKQMGRAEGEKNSVSYNENAFLVSCKSMLYLLRKPPKHFEAFVEEHFSLRSKNILSACKAYLEGAPVGCAGYEKGELEKQQGSSMGFKIMLSKLYPKLVKAFSDKGIDCSSYDVDPGRIV